VKLRDAGPHLLGIYRRHEHVEFRMMALAALHAIGDEDAMQQRNRFVREEPSDRVRHVRFWACTMKPGNPVL